MSRIVLDTNSLVQCISPKSKYRKIWDCFLDGTNLLCVSNEILNEYEEILEVGEATETTETNEIKGHIYIDTDSVIIAPLPEKKFQSLTASTYMQL